jgi:hypothetical protein
MAKGLISGRRSLRQIPAKTCAFERLKSRAIESMLIGSETPSYKVLLVVISTEYLRTRSALILFFWASRMNLTGDLSDLIGGQLMQVAKICIVCTTND